MSTRRNFCKFGAAGLAAGALSGGKRESGVSSDAELPASAAGVVVSTRPGRGDFNTADFETDLAAAQHAYDKMVTTKGLPGTLILDSSGGPFEFDGALEVWQSKCRITGTGGPTVVPAEGYTGALIETSLRKETQRGEDRVISNVIMDNLWLNGRGRSRGMKLRDLQLSTIHDLHVRSTDGPGLWLSDGVIENLFSNLILSDNCGSKEQPALLIEPESEDRPKKLRYGNHTVNSTHFSGIMIHFPTNDALRISAGPAPVRESRRHRKIKFSGCYFHGHGRQNRPLVTLEDAYELAFVGTQMLIWRKEGVIMQLGSQEARWPTGITMISHCLFSAAPGSKATGIRAVKVDTKAPCLAIFGNTFGTLEGRLAHAVDWGEQKGKKASWAGNAVHVTREPHIGVPPKDADESPF